MFAPLELGELPVEAEDPPTLKKIDKDVKSVPILLTEKKKPAPLFADALAVDKVAADVDKAAFDKSAADKTPIIDKSAFGRGEDREGAGDEERGRDAADEERTGGGPRRLDRAAHRVGRDPQAEREMRRAAVGV